MYRWDQYNERWIPFTGSVDAQGRVKIVADLLPLPTGAATSANQTNGTQKTQIVETSPTDTTKSNPSATLAYDGSGNLSTITKVISGLSYQKTLSYTDGVLTDISAWIQL